MPPNENACRNHDKLHATAPADEAHIQHYLTGPMATVPERAQTRRRTR